MNRQSFLRQFIGGGVICLVVLLGAIFSVQAEAQPSSEMAEGRLREVEAGGMAFYPGGGMPLYPGDEKWDVGFQTSPEFWAPARITAMTARGSNVYAAYTAGINSSPINPPPNNIARWNGSWWSAIGKSIEGGPITAIAANDNGDVFVGGSTLVINGFPVYGVARWDGWGWGGNNFTGTVKTLASGTDNSIYAGGCFTYADRTLASNVAWWRPNQGGWQNLGRGVSGCVSAIATSGNNVYVGGDFIAAGDGLASRIARWDGSHWYPLGAGVNGPVSKIAVSGSDVYVYGEFTQAGGQPSGRLARWDGSQWHTMEPPPDVRTMAVNGNTLYVASSLPVFLNPLTTIAAWDGTHWTRMGNEMNQPVYALAVSGNLLYAGGDFAWIGSQPANGFAQWDGSQWSAPGGLHVAAASHFAVAVKGKDVYLGGYFSQIGWQQPANNIAHWDGDRWDTLGQGVNQTVKEIVIAGEDLYAGGYFTVAGEQPANHIARWDGRQWHALGAGLDGPVFAIAANGSDIYAGGTFSQAGGQPAANIARWDGSQWQPLGSGTNGQVYAIAVNGSDVYVGGEFVQAGGLTVNYVARWDGAQWHPLGSGISTDSYSDVYALAIQGSDVYVGGKFPQAGGQPTNNLARWDGTQWHAFNANGIWGIRSLALGPDGSLYVAGHFQQQTGANFSNGIARWDGSQWSGLGSGLTRLGDDGTLYGGSAADVAVAGERVFVAGAFEYAGNKVSPGFAIWHASPEVWLSQQDGGPGSKFTVNAYYFPAGTPLNLSVNGYRVSGGTGLADKAAASALVANEYGEVRVNLATSPQNAPGIYRVSVSGSTGSGSAAYRLADGLPIRDPNPGISTTLSLPPTFGAYYLPLIAR